MEDNKTLYLDTLKDLNESKNNFEEHSLEFLSKIDTIIECTESNDINGNEIKSIAFELMDMMQHYDINVQKIQRAMNNIVEINNINKESLEKVGILNISPSAKHIDKNDGNTISDEDIEKLISNSK